MSQPKSLLLAALLCTLVVGRAGLAGLSAEPPANPGAEIMAAIEGYQESFHQWVMDVQAETDPERQAELIARQPDKNAVARRILKLVEPLGDGQPGQFVRMWVYAEATDNTLRSSALDWLLQHIGEQPQIANVMPMIERDGEPRARVALERLAIATNDEVRRAAETALASWIIRYDVESSRDRAIALLESVIRSASKQGHIESGTLVESARSRLFELRRLAVGAVAPDIGGIGLQGERLRLHDYRGRAVLLTFWAHWCSGCMAQVPMERELVETYADRPFAMLGVNADGDSPDAILERNQEHGITWPSFRSDAGGPGAGSIARRWNVRTMPTTYLIGHDGVILAKWPGAVAPHDEVVAAVEQAVTRTEAAATAWRAEDHLPTLGVGDAAPPFVAEHWPRGERIDALQRGTIYVIDFWATWCGSCIAGFPELEALQRDFADAGVVVIAATHVDDRACTLEAVQAMVDDPAQSMAFSVACSSGPETYRRWVTASGHHGIPTTIVVDREGRIASTGYNHSTREVIRQLIDGSFDYDTERPTYRAGMIAAAELERLQQLLRAGDSAAVDFARQVLDSTVQKGAWFYVSIAEVLVNNVPAGTEPDLDLALNAARRAFELREDRSDIWYDSVLADIEFRRGQIERAVSILREALPYVSEASAESYRRRIETYQSALPASPEP